MSGLSIYSKYNFDLWTKDAEDCITLRLDRMKNSETEVVIGAVDVQIADTEISKKLKLSIGPLDPLDPIKEPIEIIPDIDNPKKENGVSAAPVEILKKFKCENCGSMSLVFNRPPSKLRTNRIRHNKRHLFVVEVSS